MLLYCLKGRKKTESIKPTIAKTNKENLILLSKCVVRGSRIPRFIKKQEVNRLSISLG